MSYAKRERERERERVRLTPLAGSARKALPILLAAALLAAPGVAGATNSGGKWDNLDGDPWYVGNGGGSNGNITIDEAMTSYASGGLIYETSATDVTLDKNAVTVKDGADGDGVYGATITCDVPGTVTMKGNQVTVYGGHYYSVFGAHINSFDFYNTSKNTVTMTNNHVVINGGRLALNDNAIAGAGGATDAQSDTPSMVTGNSLTINDGTFGKKSKFYGAWLTNSRGTSVNDNSVFIKGGTFNDHSAYFNTIAGGRAVRSGSGGETDTFTASNNVVDLDNVTLVSPRIYGGYIGNLTSTNSGSATNNTVILRENLKLTDYGYLYGGYSDSTGNANLDVRTGNTLEVRTVGLTAKNVYNFENYHFILPGTVRANDIVLTLTDSDGTDISGAKVGVAVAGGSAPLKVGDSVTLLRNRYGLETKGYTQTSLTGTQGVSLAYDFTLATVDDPKTTLTTDLIATVGTISDEPGGDEPGGDEPGGDEPGGDEPGGDEPGGDEPGGDSPVHVLPQTKALSEAYLAGSLLIRQGGDFIADRGMAYALRAASATGEYGFAPFGTISGGWSRYDTGSHIDVSSLNLLAGLAKGADLAPGRFTAGVFFEYGNGSYDTWNSFSNAASIKGDGDTWYAGGGVLARMDFAETGPGHFYAEASARFGVLNNDYDNDDMRDAFGRRASYDSDSAYYGLHVGAGYVWNLSDKADLDLYARYLWTHQDSDSLHLSTGERLHFDSVDSHRLRLGARFAYTANEYVRPYIGAAWEQEFDGEARATTNGFDIDRPDLEGSTGMGELGITLTPSSTIPVSLDLGVQGYVGKREGVSGTIQLQWKF